MNRVLTVFEQQTNLLKTTSQRTQLTFIFILESVRSMAVPCTLEVSSIYFLSRQIIDHDFIDYLSIFFFIFCLASMFEVKQLLTEFSHQLTERYHTHAFDVV